MRLAVCESDRVILLLSAGLLAGALAAGLGAPPLFGLIGATVVAVGVAFLGFCFPAGFSVAWLLVAGTGLEMTLLDLCGAGAFQPAIAAVKGGGVALAGLCALRFGPRLDLLCPAWAFPAMWMAGLTHGLYPGLASADSLRSAVGSVAPWAFCFCRLPRSWPEAIVRATKWCPIVSVLGAAPLALLGLRPLFIDGGGARLAGLGHPAFLANVCLPAVYACLIALFRHGRRGDLFLLAINGAILLLSGARAPLAYAAGVCGICLISIPSATFPTRIRLILGLAVAALVPLAAVLAGQLTDIRVFNLLTHEATNLSGRDLLWPFFEAAAAKSPWFGWGVGAGNAIIPPTGRVAQTLRTWAAHNEYLRIGVEGGLLGSGLLIVLFAVWVVVRTRRLCLPERRIMRLAFLAMAGHAWTDNLLISTPACVMFTFAAAVFAGGSDGPRRQDARCPPARPDAVTNG